MNRIGKEFTVEIFGESHGTSLGVIIDGCPAGLPLDSKDFEHDMSRRQSGGKGTTPRKEPDIPEIISGVFNGYATGAPITILFKNTNVRSRDYSFIKKTPRPGHADFTSEKKYNGYQDYRGGGHFSGRLTTGLVAAGVIAKKLIHPVNIHAALTEAGGSTDIENTINNALENQDSVGGIVECKTSALPAGLGEPFFDKFEARLAHIIFAIPAIKGMDIGSGFNAATMKGSDNNDPIISTDGKTETNNAGGLNGGITNGNELSFRVSVKPTSSIGKTQRTINMKTGKMEDLRIKGRHDACIALRIPPVVEAVSAIIIADFMIEAQHISKPLQ